MKLIFQRLELFILNSLLSSRYNYISEMIKHLKLGESLVYYYKYRFLKKGCFRKYLLFKEKSDIDSLTLAYFKIFYIFMHCFENIKIRFSSKMLLNSLLIVNIVIWHVSLFKISTGVFHQ